MVQIPFVLMMSNDFLIIPSGQNSSFDIRRCNDFPKYGLPKINRVEHRLGVVFPYGHEWFPMVLHDVLPCQDKTSIP